MLDGMRLITGDRQRLEQLRTQLTNPRDSDAAVHGTDSRFAMLKDYITIAIRLRYG